MLASQAHILIRSGIARNRSDVQLANHIAYEHILKEGVAPLVTFEIGQWEARTETE